MRLTNHFIRKKVKALAGQSGKRQSNFCTLKDARHILVLFNAEDRDVVEPCLKTLRTLNKNCLLYTSKQVLSDKIGMPPA